VANTKQFQAHPLAPNAVNASSVTLPNAPGATRIIISWEDGPAQVDGQVIEHDDGG
jgi:hypothetical protein